MTRSVAYVRLIPPGAADTIHYRLQIPPDAGERIHLRTKVNYRKFAWYNTQWAYAGVRDPNAPPPAADHDDAEWSFTGDTSNVSGGTKAIPDIPTTVMAEAEATVEVVDADMPLAETLAGDAASGASDPSGTSGAPPRGDLLRGRVERLRHRSAAAGRPARRGGGVPRGDGGRAGVGRRAVQPGARPPRRMARWNWPSRCSDEAMRLGIAPARTGYFRGVALRALGQYDEALAALEEARVVYPRDRVVLNEIGRLHFLERRYDEAVSTLEAVLRIDPEDLQAHYTMMLAHRGAQRMDEAAEAQARYERFTADESSQAITGPFRRRLPRGQQRAPDDPRALTRFRAG